MGTDSKTRDTTQTLAGRVMTQVLASLIGVAIGGAASQLLGLSVLSAKVEDLTQAIRVMQQDHERINTLATEVAVLKSQMDTVKRHVGLAKLTVKGEPVVAKTTFAGEPKQLDNIDADEIKDKP